MSSTATRNGMRVRINAGWVPFYRKAGTPTEGVLLGVSPGGGVARVRLDGLADSYVRLEHLDPARG